MTLSAVAKRYADALADVVTQSGSPMRPEAALVELRKFNETLAGSQELREAFATPAVPSGRKKAVIARLAEALQLSAITRNFLYVLVDHRRMASLPEIIEDFDATVDERLGFARAEVTAASELSDAQRSLLSAELERLTGKRIRMRFAIDGTLIGGVTARIGSTIYDGSVRGRLESLERRLSAES
jgi:F-type H+-transporting ATPase subunit delta